MNRFEAAEAILRDHQLEHHQKVAPADRAGHTKRFWVTCSCGYATEPGNSWKYQISAGVGHIQRVADQFRAENGVEGGVSRRESVPRVRYGRSQQPRPEA